jgi:hypothetical protein
VPEFHTQRLRKRLRHRFVAGQRNEQIGHGASEDPNDVGVSCGVVEGISQLARSVRMDRTQRLPAFDEVSDPDVERVQSCGRWLSRSRRQQRYWDRISDGIRSEES